MHLTERATPTTILATPAEITSEKFWDEVINPAAAAVGVERPTELLKDPNDRHAHQLIGSDGQVLLVVRTDREPLCCPYHDQFPDSGRSCEEARTNRGLIGWHSVYGKAHPTA